MNVTIDIIGALLSVVSGYFYIKEKPIAWLISLIAIPFDVIMDISIGVYADLFLQFTYFILLLYGWYSWRNGAKVEDGLPIVRISVRQVSFFGVIAILTVGAIWLGLNRYTNSEVALLDAMVTCLSLVASWLLCRKILESWLLWIFVDCLYVSLYVYKAMPFHGAMSLFDAGVCVLGFMYWKREHGNAAAVVISGELDEAVPQAD